MKASKLPKRITNCPYCGAPVTTEVCSYCGKPTGLQSTQANMEYPVLDCREIIIKKRDIIFMLSMGGIFALIGGFIYLLFAVLFKEDPVFVAITAVPFAVFGLGVALFPLVNFARLLRAKLFGKVVKAKVYGYLSDDMTIDGRSAQIVKLRIESGGATRFVLYQLEEYYKPYATNSTVDVLVYRKDYRILTKPHFQGGKK